MNTLNIAPSPVREKLAEALSLFGDLPALSRLLEGQPMNTLSGEKLAPAGFSTFNNLWVLKELFGQLKPGRTLEIGLAYGASGTLFTSLHQKVSPVGKGLHHAIDPFQVKRYGGCALQYMKEHQLDGMLRFHEKSSAQVLAELIEEGLRFQIIYIDGSHLFEDVFVDFFLSHRLLDPEGVMLFDDSQDPHVQKVVRFLRTNYQDFYEELSPYDYQLGSRSKLKVKSLVARVSGRQHLTIFRKRANGERAWDAKFFDF